MHQKSRRVRDMFDRIAARYDLLNRLLSAGSDLYWRSAALSALDAPPESRILDVGVGTGDLALALVRRSAPPRIVIGVDLASGMMRIGQSKAKKNASRPVRFVCGDAETLPFAAETFDGAMVAFGVRNFADVPAGLRSIRRTLRPGGRLVVLELSRPRLPVIKQMYQGYFRHLLPRIGGFISGDGDAYRYLHTSVMGFPEREAFLRMMQEAGFSHTDYQGLSLGIATIYRGERV
ncbi:MAG: bifunctional demethylmenaquinone methyltransferase/2-methoxy-6-polyprenyl-1,4-benzoquinol methylase UbiE [candidate division Zixibacteria bacterium]|nr:bifunctional demethylmenaquinone methyltransferase/2-methoxy-6-polyprenyl-1,4-benzoquinol methylase UbiE [candidate division Zixibacteria bacterium]